MINLSKESQLQSRQVKKKTCLQCHKARDMKFFTSTRAKYCTDCLRKRKTLKKKQSKSYLNKKKDEQWSKAVKERDNHTCQYCGKKEYLNSHHIFSRSNFTTRWDLDNGITLCSGCHTFSSKFSAHKTPAEFIEWVKEKKGLAWYERLREKAKQTTKERNI